ncbi:cistern family PEP-CTERM protein [Nodosilinea sp. LEGE 06152]|uniref:cistern family PEP-CTERM protein n=1 Tax=Nodosilinea sp. LEGE 06152 TaxID=2777966 RepID=UPI001881F466|nr:cistern family PEP-CTERM protein [Nodosilinea sp. LEGE 06152]MBE9155746.1 cistern family PEP-CTERM protein [Nodosilinea sp. LEGE 06152]
MTTKLNRLSVSALAAGALMAAGSFASQPAQAITFNTVDNTVTFDASSIGQEFKVFFRGGNVGSNALTPNPFSTDGLQAVATFVLTAFNGSSADFDITVDNNSSGDVTAARLSVLGFNVDTPNGQGSFSLGGTRTASAPIAVASGNTPQNFGDVDVCFKTPGSQINNCNNGNGGVLLGGSLTFSPTLAFTSPGVSQFTLSNFYARYQSINGNFGGTTVTGASGVGNVGVVPTPALLPGLFGLGVAALRKRQQEEGEVA